MRIVPLIPQIGSDDNQRVDVKPLHASSRSVSWIASPGFFGGRMQQIRAGCEAALGADVDRIWAEGSRLGIDEALAFGAPRPRAPAASGLSTRELEVVRLVADGLANKAIAAQLHLSVRTVESHVRHVLAKAGLSNRTQLAQWAREHNQ